MRSQPIINFITTIILLLPNLAFSYIPPIPSSSRYQHHHQQQQQQQQQQGKTIRTFTTALHYEPKWKKKETLADQSGDINFQDIGITGSIPVVFKQGDEIKKMMAKPGDPLRDVASQAGQFIKYGCGKGECGTCEVLCGGKWIRPCSTNVPQELENGQTELVIQVKQIKSKTKSSGKFFSVRSFFMGFYNNLLGMVGFVLTRKAAKKNYGERMEFEDLVAKRVREKKEAKMNSEMSSEIASALAEEKDAAQKQLANTKK